MSEVSRPMLALDGPYCVHIFNADDSVRPGPWQKLQRRLPCYLLVCSLEGEERITVEGVPFVVARGSSYLIQPGRLSDIGSARGNRPVWIHFGVRHDPSQARPEATAHFSYTRGWNAVAASVQPDSQRTWGVDLPVLVPGPLRTLFADRVARIVRLWKRATPQAVLESHHALAGLLLAWVLRGLQPAGRDSAARIARAEALAFENPGASVGDLADAAGMSRSRFSLLFRQRSGRTAGAFLRHRRMQEAENLLARSELPVADIARMAGYSDATAFGRVFRRSHHCTPGAWRARMRR